ncbi:MAG: ACP S-malonyltransferase [Firmicutes bacterium]|nr:ACP S-malonyltransferase [Bacillota bacterium]
MKKIAFVFPGQGSQYVGMGKEVSENYSEAKAVFMEADRVLGRNLTELCFNGPKELLMDTRNAQPAILTASIALLQALKAEGIRADYTAGHSLGEYSALVASEVLDFSEAISLVQKRAELMAGADPDHKGTMAAVLGMDRETLAGCLAEAQKTGPVEAANFNCPGQIVISGVKTAIAKARELVAAKGGNSIPLSVSGPFHSSFMKSAADAFKIQLESISWKEPTIPVIANVSAKAYHSGEIIDNLYRQVYSSVLWEDSINYLRQQGVEIFVEIGPGRVLSGLIKKTLKDVTIVNCEDLASIKKALDILKEV